MVHQTLLFITNRLAKVICLIFLLLFSHNFLFAQIEMAPIFKDGMVLQRGSKIPVWGTSKIKKGNVAVRFRNEVYTTKTDNNGEWKINLNHKSPVIQGSDLTIRIKGSGQKEENKTIKDVLVGEVWLCSGQSNMRRTISGYDFANNSEYLKEREGLRSYSNYNPDWNEYNHQNRFKMQAVSYYFGIEIYNHFNPINPVTGKQRYRMPVGLVNLSVGGTQIETWMSKSSYQSLKKEFNSKGIRMSNRSDIGKNYDELIEPFLPYRFKGIVWWQGEANLREAPYYGILLNQLIHNWREQWEEKSGFGLDNFPFYFIQVPTQLGERADETRFWNLRRSANILRESMRNYVVSSNEYKNLGMAIAYDLSDRNHPFDYQPIGNDRLARLVLNKAYGRVRDSNRDTKEYYASGPLLQRIRFNSKQAVCFFLWQHNRLQNKTNSSNNKGEQFLEYFEIAGADKVYYPAKAWIPRSGNKVIVESSKVRNPKYVRYLYRDYEVNTDVSLYNSAGLPASPFIYEPGLIYEPNDYANFRQSNKKFNATAINSFSEDLSTFVNISPNPVSSSFTVELSSEFNKESTTITVINIINNNVVKQFNYAENLSYNASNLSSGNYIVVVSDGVNTATKQIIKN